MRAIKSIMRSSSSSCVSTFLLYTSLSIHLHKQNLTGLDLEILVATLMKEWSYTCIPPLVLHVLCCCIPFQLCVAYVNQRLSHVCSEIIMRYPVPTFVWTERLDDCREARGSTLERRV
jgi:hypothetical protein